MIVFWPHNRADDGFVQIGVSPELTRRWNYDDILGKLRELKI